MGIFQKKIIGDVHSLFKPDMSFQINEMNSNNKTNNLMIDKVWMGTDHWIQSFPPWMPPEENPMDNAQSMCNDDLSQFVPQIPPAAWLNNGKILVTTSNSNNRTLQDCNPRFKTEICRNFKERNKCIYGDRCQFAHGRQELRDVVRNSKYKTKLCQKYWISGYCAYGPRCNFLHEEATNDELEMADLPQPSTNNNHVEEFIMNVIPEDEEEPMEQNMEDLIPTTMEPMEQKESMENKNRPRTTTPTNIMDVNHLVFGSSFNDSVTPMTTEEAMAQFQHYL